MRTKKVTKFLAALLCTALLVQQAGPVFAVEPEAFDPFAVEETVEVQEDAPAEEGTVAPAEEEIEKAEAPAEVEEIEKTETPAEVEETEEPETPTAPEQAEETEDAESEEEVEIEDEETPTAAATVKYEAKVGDATVTVIADKDALPEEAELVATPVEVTEEIQANIEQEAIASQKAIKSVVAYDIKFVVDGKEVEPESEVAVKVALPEVNAGDTASVYHYDEKKDTVEDMAAAVDAAGDVAFGTDHFSTYVIVNSGTNTVTVKIQHYDATTKQPIYTEDTLTLPAGRKIEDFNKAANWEVTEIYEVGGEDKNLKDEEIKVVKDTTYRVYYTKTSGTMDGTVTFYDYTVNGNAERGCYNKNGELVTTNWDEYDQKYRNSDQYKWFDKYNTINNTWNYSDPTSEEPANRFGISNVDWYGYTYRTVLNGQEINSYKGGAEGVKTGIIKGLSGTNYENVDFNVDEPGVFSREEKTGKTVVDGYSLKFDRNGDTYVLKAAYNGNNKVSDAGNAFFPLDDIPNDDFKEHNFYYGMRYDVDFTLGGYIGNLEYAFTGDDDLWVILDGTDVVIDLGGIHDALSGTASSDDLWAALMAKEGVTDKTQLDPNKVHRLTVLYMERGAAASNCQMNFTLPNARLVDVNQLGTVEFTKYYTEDGKQINLSGAKFKLVDNSDSTKVLTAESKADGKVTFSAVPLGTYTLTEVSAPDGFITAKTFWTAYVTKEGTIIESEIRDSSNRIVTKIENTKYDPDLVVNKTSKLIDWDERSYEIDMSVESELTEVSTLTEDIDVVLVLDKSGSMDYTRTVNALGRFNDVKNQLDKKKTYYAGDSPIKHNGWYWAYDGFLPIYPVSWDGNPMIYESANHTVTRLADMKAAAKDFATNMATFAPNSNISIVSFASSNYGKVSVDLALGKVSSANIDSALNKISAYGGTSPSLGLEEARKQLSKNTGNTKKYVILFTDGEPTGNGNVWDKQEENASISKAQELKDAGIIVYTVGLNISNNATNFLKTLATPATEDKTYSYIVSDSAGIQAVFNNLSKEITSDLDAKGVKVVDVLNENFEIYDAAERQRLIDEGATISEDGRTITWENQTVPSTGKTYTIKVKAKDSFLGGNNIPTNVYGVSKVTYNTKEYPFPEPTVNVKAEISVNVDPQEKTIFLGELVPTDAETINQMFTVPENEANKYTLTWYKDKDLTEEISFEDLKKLRPTEDVKFYLKVTYTEKFSVPTGASLANSTIGDVEYCAGDAENEYKLIATDSDVYTIKVISGEITITKQIKSDDYKTIEGDPIFTYKIEGTNELGDHVIFYKTLHIKSGDKTTQTATIEGLAKGVYTITELKSLRYDVESVVVDAANTTSAYTVDGKAVKVAIGYKDYEGFTSGTDKKKAAVIYKNKKLDDGGLTHTDVSKNSLVIGEAMTQSEDADNGTTQKY